MDIDLVYLYVNGNDIEWRNKRNKYASEQDLKPCRFRDNNELKYSLRSVEKYAQWIRKIYIVSDSQIPDWLNTNDERVSFINHSEIIPMDVLPLYNSMVIELFLSQIPGLSNYFIYAKRGDRGWIKDLLKLQK